MLIMRVWYWTKYRKLGFKKQNWHAMYVQVLSVHMEPSCVKQCNFLCRKISTTENKPFIVSIEGNIGKSLLKFWRFCVYVSRKGICIGFDLMRILWLLFPSLPFWGSLRIRIRDPVFFWPLDPDPGYRTQEIRDKHLGSYFHIFGLIILCTFIVADTDPGFGVENLDSGWKNSDPG
jgi:hypothetical protein